MKCNIGKTDKAIRLVISVISLILAIKVSLWFIIVALISAGTAITGFCLLYEVLGINTCRDKNEESSSSQ